MQEHSRISELFHPAGRGHTRCGHPGHAGHPEYPWHARDAGLRGRLANGLGAFWRHEKGAVTIEFVTLVPFFMALFLFFVDASMLYMTYSDMLVTAGDVSRKMSIGEVQSVSQARDYAAERLSLRAGSYTLDANFMTFTVTISIPLVDASLSGWWMQAVLGSTLYATSTTQKEPLN